MTLTDVTIEGNKSWGKVASIARLGHVPCLYQLGARA